MLTIVGLLDVLASHPSFRFESYIIFRLKEGWQKIGLYRYNRYQHNHKFERFPRDLGNITSILKSESRFEHFYKILLIIS